MAPSVYFIFSTPLVYKKKLNRLFLGVCVCDKFKEFFTTKYCVQKKSNVSHKQTASNHTANNKKILVKKKKKKKKETKNKSPIPPRYNIEHYTANSI